MYMVRLRAPIKKTKKIYSNNERNENVTMEDTHCKKKKKVKEEQMRYETQRTKRKIEGVNTTIAIITLTVDGLNKPIKNQTVRLNKKIQL